MEPGISIQFTMPVAAEEAKAAGAGQIETRHVFCAGLKFVELDARAFESMIRPVEAVPMVVRERDRTREVLEQRGIAVPEDAARIRRELRAAARPAAGPAVKPPDGLQRSEELRALCARAEDAARTEGAAFYELRHLLRVLFENPPEEIARLLPQASWNMTSLPDHAGVERQVEFAVDLTERAAKGLLPRVNRAEADPVCVVLRDFLAAGDGRPVVLVQAGTRLPVEVVENFAHLCAHDGGGRGIRRLSVLSYTPPRALSLDEDADIPRDPLRVLADRLGRLRSSNRRYALFLDLSGGTLAEFQSCGGGKGTPESRCLAELAAQRTPAVVSVRRSALDTMAKQSPGVLRKCRVVWVHDLADGGSL